MKCWAKILHMPDHRYLKQCYILLRSLSDAGKMTRATKVKNFLYVYGFGYVWEANTIGNINAFVKRLIDWCHQTWHGDISDSPKSML